jgi:hypothetical protein
VADLLPELLDAELAAGEWTPDLSLPGTSFIVPGLSRSQSVTELAELLSGVEGPGRSKSKAYRSARRQAERMTKPGSKVKPKPATLRRVQGALRQQNERVRSFKAHGANMRVLVSVFSDSKPGWLPPHDWIQMPREVMRTVTRMWAAGEKAEAADTLFVEFLIRYNVPNPEDWLREAEIIALKLEPRE